jgi:hypothetical protein
MRPSPQLQVRLVHYLLNTVSRNQFLIEISISDNAIDSDEEDAPPIVMPTPTALPSRGAKKRTTTTSMDISSEMAHANKVAKRAPKLSTRNDTGKRGVAVLQQDRYITEYQLSFHTLL